MAFFPLVLPRGRTAPSWPYPPSRAACGCGLPKPYKFILCHLINGQMQSSIVMSKIKRCVLTSRSWIFVRSCSRLPADYDEKIDPFHQHALNPKLGGPAVDMIVNILERINDCLNWPVDDLLHPSLARKVLKPMRWTSWDFPADASCHHSRGSANWGSQFSPWSYPGCCSRHRSWCCR